MPPPLNNKKVLFYNGLFLLICGGIFLFLWNAPPETTAKLHRDEYHQKFFSMDKKEAEKECQSCHNPQGDKPLPPDHPPKYRCLFCHKKDK